VRAPVRLAAPLLGVTARVLASTWRFRDARTGRPLPVPMPLVPALYALWHEHLLPLAFLHRGQGAMAVVSQHRDGEILARTLRALGYEVARGSSTRGGAAAFRALVSAGRVGRPLAVTPDGPRGPRRRAGQGAVRVATAAGLRIIPVAAAAERGWRLASWDRFLVPGPATRIWVAHGEPIDPDPESGTERLAAELEALDETCRAAAEGSGPRILEPDPS